MTKVMIISLFLILLTAGTAYADNDASVETKDYVTWGSLSLVIAGIAQGKNRSGLGWWIGSLIFGPLALFCLVVFAHKLPEETSSEDV